MMKSDAVRQGMQQAPHRSLFNALGHTEEEMKKPLIGIVSSYNEIVPGHMNLDKIVEAVKLGVAMAGGVPVVFPAIAVCDGLAMGHIGMKYSLVTRDLIADSTECMAKAHQFDALVMVPNCDKNVPGLLMAAARVNVPTIFVSGGPMLAGHVKGCKTSLSSMFEAVGAYAAGPSVRRRPRFSADPANAFAEIPVVPFIPGFSAFCAFASVPFVAKDTCHGSILLPHIRKHAPDQKHLPEPRSAALFSSTFTDKARAGFPVSMITYPQSFFR